MEKNNIENIQQNNNSNNKSNKNAYALISMVLGLASLGAWLLPILGYIISILGIIFGCISREARKSSMSLIGIISAIIGLILTVLNSVLGFLLIFLMNIV